MGHHKHGHKKYFDWSKGDNKHNLKGSWLATAGAWSDAGKTLNKTSPLFKPLGVAFQTVGGIEALPVAGIDAMTAKNPSERFKKDMNIRFGR